MLGWGGTSNLQQRSHKPNQLGKRRPLLQQSFIHPLLVPHTYTYHPWSAALSDNRTYPTPTVLGDRHLSDPSVTRDHEAGVVSSAAAYSLERLIPVCCPFATP